MNKPLKWGLGFFAGVFGANLLWHLGLESPSAEFFTAGWWRVWAAAYGVAIIAFVIGLGLLVVSRGRRSESD